ncbi:flagellar biosynthesis anti-sigma factor FlgM [Paenibacillus lupini]|jgi:negative regulator of flagellin synthesis FlgM|uniref:flagellar biosynthesis anti-sigma factor FlgM n=1 Tax=Paenibacillus TaxID=44249 RepID=UPI00141E276C|nr:flagellar biosynthesis anti-sigma factor FlgM [Paenibacillus lupini]NIK25628.1 negative regulator of flagellin synthesis FlgM [Paenibacillus lupini]
MKINETNRIGAYNNYQKQMDQRVDSANKKKQKDIVEISAEAKEMLSTSQTNSPERQKRIEELKQSVSAGTYKVDAGKIADKLLPYLKG